MSQRDYSQYGVIWDLDGVLVDSGRFHYLAWKEVFARRGIEFSEADFRKVFGRNNRSTLEVIFGRTPTDEEAAEISREKEEIFLRESQGKSTLLPGAANLLEEFKQGRFKQAIGSSAPLDNVNQIVDELKIRPYFDALVSGSAYPSKPHPGIFQAAAREIDIPAKRCLVIEDSTAGIEAAHRAGMTCLAVATTNPLKDLHHADMAVFRLDEARLSEILKKMDGNHG